MTSGNHKGITRLYAQHQRRLSNRVHARGDAAARQHGWAITVTTEQLGSGGRVYRNHRLITHPTGHLAGRTPVGQRHTSRAR